LELLNKNSESMLKSKITKLVYGRLLGSHLERVKISV